MNACFNADPAEARPRARQILIRHVGFAALMAATVFVAMTGCRFALPDHEPAVDAPTTTEAMPSRALIAVPTSDWSAPEPIGAPINTTANENSAALSSDGLVLYFASDRADGKGGFDIWVSRRTSSGAPWGTPRNLEMINTSADELSPNLSFDGRSLMFASDRLGNSDLYLSRRANPADDLGWSSPANPFMDSSTPNDGPMFVKNPETGWGNLYFSRVFGGIPYGGAQEELVYVAVTPQGTMRGPTVHLDSLNSVARELAPSVRGDEREIFFSRGNKGLWTSTRESAGQDWSAPVKLADPLNIGAAETNPDLSFDGQTLIFSTNRSPTVGGRDLWFATRTVTWSWPSNAKAITVFSFPSVPATGTINESSRSIAVTVPYGTDVRGLVATFTATGVSVKVGSTEQVSGVTANDFTHPVTYTVTAEDGTTASYGVTVAVLPEAAKAITSFSLATAAGTIDEYAKTITLTVPDDWRVTSFRATFTATGSGVTVGSTVQVSGVTMNDFSYPVIYTVTAIDGSTANYTVIVKINPAITYFNVGGGFTGTKVVIDQDTKAIAVTIPYGSSVSALVAIYSSNVSNVTVGSTLQVSGVTPNDFADPVVYTVKAADGTTAAYIVTVTVAAIDAKEITWFELGVAYETDTIVGTSILAEVPQDTDVTSVAASFGFIGASVKVGSTEQQPGVTVNDFSGGIVYTVTAPDGSTVDYVVYVQERSGA